MKAMEFTHSEPKTVGRKAYSPKDMLRIYMVVTVDVVSTTADQGQLNQMTEKAIAELGIEQVAILYKYTENRNQLKVNPYFLSCFS